jgi:hypothetical protein
MLLHVSAYMVIISCYDSCLGKLQCPFILTWSYSSGPMCMLVYLQHVC